MAKQKISIFWFRRDLRLHDNAGLYHALKAEYAVLPVFIFDTDILDDLEEKADRRVAFIRDTLVAMQEKLERKGSTLRVLHGKPVACFKELVETYAIDTVFTNHDYEPYAKERDKEIAAYLENEGIAFHSYKDQVIFEKGEVLKDNGEPYTVYTPYSKKWKAKLNHFYLKPYPTEKYLSNLYRHAPRRMPSLKALGFEDAAYQVASPRLNKGKLDNYKKQRDIPALDSTTHLSVHLRFGTVSIRELAGDARKESEDFLNELIWREFFQMILWHFPHVVNYSFKEDYNRIKWRNNEKEFELWCNGMTGFPIVDAGMRELNETGYMHNRVRMIAASFLTKDLLIDWRWGEAYFAEKLLDFDLSANNGGWQWSAGCGTDAAPYFRIFNPLTQADKFDKDRKYINHWVPEVGTSSYPEPIVDLNEGRDRCLRAYKKALAK